MLDTHIVGMVIESFRKKRGLSQEVASGLAPISRKHLSSIECGSSSPSLDVIFRISGALRVWPSTLVAAIEEAMQQQK